MLVLWDVDRTLIAGGPATLEAINAAVAGVLGREVSYAVTMSGKTDPQILDEILTAQGLGPHDRAELVPKALALLGAEFAARSHRLPVEGRVLPGVEAVLAHLHAQAHVVQTLLTGNIKANALRKVAAFGLDRWLLPDAGAYGDDHPDRTRLVPVALRRTRALTGRTVGTEATWVVGDTPRDLRCARSAGVRCALVATGRFSVEELARESPEVVLPDLADVSGVVELLLGGR